MKTRSACSAFNGSFNNFKSTQTFFLMERKHTVGVYKIPLVILDHIFNKPQTGTKDSSSLKPPVSLQLGFACLSLSL